MGRPGLIAAAMLLLSTFAALAADCNNAADQQSMNACAADAYAASDAELNARYRQIRQRLQGDEAARDLLAAAQRAWITFRDTDCAFSASAVAGGSIYPTIYAQCADRLTRQRINDFDTYLACSEGDLSCPVPP